MPEGATLFNGPIATEWFRLCVIKSGMELEQKGLSMSRVAKCSVVAKEWLAAHGVTWKGRPISARTRIPLEELIVMFADAKQDWAAAQGSDLSENIT